MSRADPTKCRSGKHEWIPENIYHPPAHVKPTCRLCFNEAQLRRQKSQQAELKVLREFVTDVQTRIKPDIFNRLMERARKKVEQEQAKP